MEKTLVRMEKMEKMEKIIVRMEKTKVMRQTQYDPQTRITKDFDHVHNLYQTCS
jgi:hypothetical protein